MSAVIESISVDHNPLCGGLLPGVRPGVDGWYWCQREGYVAPEIVHVLVTKLARGSKVFTVSEGELAFAGSTYDSDRTKWFGPIAPPPAWGRL